MGAFVAVSAILPAQAESVLDGPNTFSSGATLTMADFSNKVAKRVFGNNEDDFKQFMGDIGGDPATLTDLLVAMINDRGVKELNKNQTLALNTGLKMLGYLEGTVTDEATSLTLAAMRNYYREAPLSSQDTVKIKLYVENNISLILENGIIRPQSAEIADLVLDAVIEDLHTENVFKASSRAGLREAVLEQMDDLAVSLEKSLGGLSVSHPKLMNENIASSNAEGEIYLMIPPDERKGSIKNRMQERLKWELIKDTIEENGAVVDVYSATVSDGEAKETWTRDPAFVIGNVAYIPDNRLREQMFPNFQENETYGRAIQQMKIIYESRGLQTVFVEGAWFEGGNIIVHQGGNKNSLFLGLEDWADPKSLELLINKINETQPSVIKYEGYGVILTAQDTYYHLDLIMSPELSGGEHFIYADAMSKESFDTINKVIGSQNLIAVGEETASLSTLNLIEIKGKTLLATSETPEFKTLSEARGYRVVGPSDYGLDTFGFGRGGVHCLTAEYKP